MRFQPYLGREPGAGGGTIPVRGLRGLPLGRAESRREFFVACRAF